MYSFSYGPRKRGFIFSMLRTCFCSAQSPQSPTIPQSFNGPACSRLDTAALGRPPVYTLTIPMRLPMHRKKKTTCTSGINVCIYIYIYIYLYNL